MLARKSKVLTVSLPEAMFEEAERVAKEENRTRSELFREALRQYIAGRRRWQQIRSLGNKSAKELGIKSEADVERLIDEFRSKNR